MVLTTDGQIMWISIKALKQDGFVEILVVDNGRGMSTEKLVDIREKLSQRHFEHQASYSDQKAVYRDCQCQ